LLSAGKFVGWFQGKMECGSRALGGRSILAGTSEAAKRAVNRQVKLREPWRPFCPSLVDTRAGDFIEAANECAFMVVAYRGTERARSETPGVVHIDGTVRPQVVTQAANPTFYRLIERFGSLDGNAIVLNTSFNLRGEPIVCSPIDALKCFFGTGLD